MTGPTGATDPAALAERYGLTKSSLRPPLGAYLRELWSRRQFVVSYARARTYAMYAGARLGSLWQVLTPLLNAAVYYLAFGVLLGTKNGIDNYVAFLLSGIFVFTYTQRCMTEGSRSLALNLSLIRTLHFPRATLPLAYVLNELNQMLVSMGILLVIVGVDRRIHLALAARRPRAAAADHVQHRDDADLRADRHVHLRHQPTAAVHHPDLAVRVRDLLLAAGQAGPGERAGAG